LLLGLRESLLELGCCNLLLLLIWLDDLLLELRLLLLCRHLLLLVLLVDDRHQLFVGESWHLALETGQQLVLLGFGLLLLDRDLLLLLLRWLTVWVQSRKLLLLLLLLLDGLSWLLFSFILTLGLVFVVLRRLRHVLHVRGSEGGEILGFGLLHLAGYRRKLTSHHIRLQGR
jgi:hypothetical protein